MDKYEISVIDTEYHSLNLPMKLYSISNDYMVDYGILYGFESKKVKNTPAKRDMVVTGVSRVYDEESGKNLYKILGYTNTAVTLYAEESVYNSAAEIGSIADDMDTVYTGGLKKGDIIKYGIDSVTGWMSEIFVLYRDGDGLYLDGTSSSGSNNDIDELKPFQIDTSWVVTNTTSRTASSGRRYIYGWVYDIKGSVIEITTQDLSTGATYWKDVNPDNTTYYSEYFRITPFSKIKIEYMDDKDSSISVSGGSASDIKTYKNVGRNCSRVLISLVGNQSSDMHLTIINDYR